MIDQTIIVTQILKELNNVSIPTSTVEKDLSIAPGYLWKVKKGKKTLGEDKMKLLEEYHAKNCKKVKHVAPVIIHTPKKNLLPTKNMPFVEIQVTEPKKKSEQPKPGSLADMMKSIRSESGRSVAQPYKRPTK
jgi:hypothetical protein